MLKRGIKTIFLTGIVLGLFALFFLYSGCSGNKSLEPQNIEKTDKKVSSDEVKVKGINDGASASGKNKQGSSIPPGFWKLFKEKKYDDAVVILEDLLKKEPDNIETMRFAGDCYYLSGKTDKARKTGELILEKDPGNLHAQRLMGNILFYKKKDAGKAIGYYKRALAQKPDDRSTFLSLMEAYFYIKDIPSVISALEVYLKKNPNDYQALVIMGEAYIERGSLKDAQRILKRALEIEPDDAVTWVLLGEAYMDNKEFNKSLEALNKAKEIDPSNEDVYLDIGEIYYWRGDYKKGEELIRKSMSMNPDYFSPYNEIGNLYYLQKRYDDAEKYHKEALKRFPEYFDAYRGLGKIYFARKEYRKAEEAFLKALEYKPAFQGETCVYLAELYKETKEPLKEQKILLHGIETDPNYPGPYRYLIEYYKINKRFKDAERIKVLMEERCVPGKVTSKTGQ